MIIEHHYTKSLNNFCYIPVSFRSLTSQVTSQGTFQSYNIESPPNPLPLKDGHPQIGSVTPTTLRIIPSQLGETSLTRSKKLVNIHQTLYFRVKVRHKIQTEAQDNAIFLNLHLKFSPKL